MVFWQTVFLAKVASTILASEGEKSLDLTFLAFHLNTSIALVLSACGLYISQGPEDYIPSSDKCLRRAM